MDVALLLSRALCSWLSLSIKKTSTFFLVILFFIVCVSSHGFAQKKKSIKTPISSTETRKSPGTVKSLEDTKREKAEFQRLDSITQLYDELPFIGKIHLIAKSTSDSVVLRWAPSKSGIWKTYNSIGYYVERKSLSEGASVPFKRMNELPLKPWTLQEWKQRSTPDQQYAAIAVQCLYGRVTIPDAKTSVDALVNASKELENKYGFALFSADNDPHSANGLGLRFVDKLIAKNETYLYRIVPARMDTVFILDTGYISVTVGESTPLPKVDEITKEEREGRVMLMWKNTFSYYSGFHVYRKDESGMETRLTSTPVVAMTAPGMKSVQNPYFEDTTAGYYKTWTYSIRGVDAFGDISEPSTIVAMGRDRTPPPIPTIKRTVLFGTTAVLSWDYKPTADLAGFVVERSDSLYTRYKPLTTSLLPKDARSYRDTLASAAESFYNIMAVDTAGNYSDFFPFYVEIKDTIPPSPPQLIAATIDTSGVVKLVWNLGKEQDLLGYRVLWANDSTHEFTQRTNLVLQDTVFYDSVSVQTLTKNIYYKLVAVDNRYMHSEATKIITLRRPDILAPESPIFSDVFVTDSSVILSWEYSRSVDVKEQKLYRRKKGESAWNIIQIFSPKASRFTDTSVAKRAMYEYYMVAVDSSGLVSPIASIVQGRAYDTGSRPTVDDVLTVYDAKSNTISVRWKYPQRLKERYWFVVYRGFEGYELRQYQSVQSSELQFVDNDLLGRGRYRYAIRVLSDYGESPLSVMKEIEVR